jgi:hypothetical protein
MVFVLWNVNTRATYEDGIAEPLSQIAEHMQIGIYRRTWSSWTYFPAYHHTDWPLTVFKPEVMDSMTSIRLSCTYHEHAYCRSNIEGQLERTFNVNRVRPADTKKKES